jgi:predicted HicB family RNase H-like nuclease
MSIKCWAKAFVDSVDDYLAFCAERNETPERPFSGKFMLRIPPKLHRDIYIQAQTSGKSLNGWVTETLKTSIQSNPVM